MKIRDRILIYFSSTVIALTAISFVVVYLLFAAYREEEFQQHQNEKIGYTIKLLAEYKEMSQELAYLMDEQTIHDFYDEKMLIYDSQKDLVFASLDSLPIQRAHQILQQLSPSTRWIETREGNYDLIGVYVEHNNKGYYAISKAYDNSGHSKIAFLRNVLIIMFFIISVVVIFVSLYLSNKIARPITHLAESLINYDLSQEDVKPLKSDSTTFELVHLTDRFNELLQRSHEAFAFQKNTIHHISHELKTPLAVLVSELEKLAKKESSEALKKGVIQQAQKAKSLGGIIQVLLEISKIDSGQEIPKKWVRLDELLFDLIGEMNVLYPDVHFEIHYFPLNIDEQKLTHRVNEMLIRHAFLNLLTNAAMYTTDGRVEVRIDGSHPKKLTINFFNTGETISETEQKKLFHQYFRGKNSQNKKGFGLGLVLTQKIITHHRGHIQYRSTADKYNNFEVQLYSK